MGTATKKQKKREQVAQLCEQISRRFDKSKSENAAQLRATNRRIDKRKGRTAQ